MFDASTYFLLIPVDGGAIDVSVAGLESGGDGGRGVGGAEVEIPCSEAEEGDAGDGVEGEGDLVLGGGGRGEDA